MTDPGPEVEPNADPTAQDTAIFPAVRRPLRLSVFVLIAASLAGATFLAAAYLGKPSASEVTAAALPSTPSAGAKAQPAKPADDYFLGISATDKRPAEPPPYANAGVPRLFLHYAFPGWPAGAKLTFHWLLDGKDLPVDLAKWSHQSRAAFATGFYELSPPPASAASQPPPAPAPAPPTPAAKPAAPAQPGALPQPVPGPPPQPTSGFPAGIYQVEIDGPEDLKEIGSFAVLIGLDQMLTQEPPPAAVLITPPVLAAAVDKQSRPTKPLPPSIRPDTQRLFACFSYQGAAPGTVVEVRWFFGDVEVDAARSQVTLPSAFGQASAWFERHGTPLPEGKWTVAVYLPEAQKPSAQLAFTVAANALR
jgi:hypothetical protein